MKKLVATVVLFLLAAALTVPASAQTKTIKDNAEYNAYANAMSINDPKQKVAALEEFLTQYPNTIIKEEVLDLIMNTAQTAGNVPLMKSAAERLFDMNAKNAKAAFVLAYLNMTDADRLTGDPAKNALATARKYAEACLANLDSYSPAGVAPDALKQQKALFAQICNTAAGRSALATNDLPAAQKYLRAAAEASPNDVQILYPLSLAYLQDKKNDESMRQGFWFIARALNLVANNPAAVKQIGDYAKAKYKFFHGSDEGWDQVMAKAATGGMPPADFTVVKYVPPSPEEQVQKLLNETPAEKMDFGLWIFCLTNGTQAQQDQVWNVIHGKAVPFLAKVITATPDTLTLAVSLDGFDNNTPEVTVTMEPALKTLPEVGAQIKMQAVAQSYVLNPFMMTLTQGEWLDAPKPKGKPTPKARPKTKKK